MLFWPSGIAFIWVWKWNWNKLICLVCLAPFYVKCVLFGCLFVNVVRLFKFSIYTFFKNCFRLTLSTKKCNANFFWYISKLFVILLENFYFIYCNFYFLVKLEAISGLHKETSTAVKAGVGDHIISHHQVIGVSEIVYYFIVRRIEGKTAHYVLLI